MRRTKTPKQIIEQLARVNHAILLKHWDGTQYRDESRMKEKMTALAAEAWRWIDNIYLIHGMNRREQQTLTPKSNNVWANGALPRAIYAATSHQNKY